MEQLLLTYLQYVDRAVNAGASAQSKAQFMEWLNSLKLPEQEKLLELVRAHKKGA